MHIHILGICGTLMGSIALLAREAGHRVSGCDENVYPPMSVQLEQAGIPLQSPYATARIPDDTDLVIVGNAGLPRGNPVVEQMLDRPLAYVSGAEWLGQHLLTDRWVIAVSGTHGKTTTTSMIAWILDQADLNPGFLIGGVPQNFDRSARLGDAPFFVIEADEYDTSYFDHQSKFLHYRPRTLVVNNLEFDHADIFDDLDDIKDQFHLLLRKIPGNGAIICPSYDANVEDLLEMGCWTPLIRTGPDGDICARNVAADGSSFDVVVDRQTAGRVSWALTGKHNVANALAAIAASRHAGVPAAIACSALSLFQGVRRRMESVFEGPGLTVYDDFAHHPTAIESTLNGLRAKYPSEPIAAVIEPASHTMRQGVHAARLSDAAAAADHVLWFEPGNLDWDMRAHVQDGNQRVIADFDELHTQTLQLLKQHGIRHLVIMSNGGFNGFQTSLINRLREGRN